MQGSRHSRFDVCAVCMCVVYGMNGHVEVDAPKCLFVDCM